MAGEEVIIGQAGMPVYDMFFFVLARRYDAALAFLDQKLKDAAAKYSITLP